MSTAFVSVPLFSGISEEGLAGLGEVFEPVEVAAGGVLFSTGEVADRLYLLVRGRVSLREDGENTIDLQPISLIGELGAMVGLYRRVTAVAVEDSMFLAASGADLRTFFERNASVAVTFYQNLLGMSADKIRRDERRLDDMRHNLMKTQRTLKAMRDLILESAPTALSEPLHDMVEDLIAQNRRANYVITPPAALPVAVRRGNGETATITQMSRRFIAFAGPALASETAGASWRGALVLPGDELPLTGTVEVADSDHIKVNLDLLIEELTSRLEAYLTQAQLLDILL